MAAGEGRALTTNQKMEQAFDLRRDGWEFDDIAKKLKTTPNKAAQLVFQKMAKIRAYGEEILSNIKLMEDQRLLRAIREVMRIITNRNTTDTKRLQAVRVLCVLSERRSRLLGLNAPVTIEQEVHAFQHRDIDAELIQFGNALAKRIASGQISVGLDSASTPEPVDAIEVEGWTDVAHLDDRGGAWLGEDEDGSGGNIVEGNQ